MISGFANIFIFSYVLLQAPVHFLNWANFANTFWIITAEPAFDDFPINFSVWTSFAMPFWVVTIDIAFFQSSDYLIWSCLAYPFYYMTVVDVFCGPSTFSGSPLHSFLVDFVASHWLVVPPDIAFLDCDYLIISSANPFSCMTLGDAFYVF